MSIELKSLTVLTSGLARFGQNEDEESRTKRMKAFWAEKTNQVIYPVGKLLSVKVDGGKTVAQLLAEKEEIKLASVKVADVELPLQPGFTLSLANLIKVWACPACRSAHGSGVAPSRAVDAAILADNKFYYRPSDKALFVISDTCWSKYTMKLIGKDKLKGIFREPVKA